MHNSKPTDHRGVKTPAWLTPGLLAVWMLGAVSALAVGPASAATDTGAVTVSTAITVACTLSATGDMAFSNAITSTAGQTYDAQGSFSVNCTDYGPYGISIPISSNGSSSTQRRLHNSSASSYLLYDVFASTSDRSTTTRYNTAATSTGQTGTGSAQNYTIYGRIPVQSVTPAVGSYTDTLTVTIGY